MRMYHLIFQRFTVTSLFRRSGVLSLLNRAMGRQRELGFSPSLTWLEALARAATGPQASQEKEIEPRALAWVSLVKDGLALVILAPKCWDDSCVLSHLILCMASD